MSERVTLSIAGHVATVTLSRPEKHNAIDLQMLDALAATAEQLRGKRGLRAVILCGAGPSFCSGLDFQAVTEALDLQGLAEILDEQPPNRFQRAAHAWVELPLPVIAAIHGHCLGGGLQIALAADIRIATPDSRLAIMETHWGLIPDMGITRTLPRVVSGDVAKLLTFTGRRLSGTEAAALGLVTQLAEDPLGAATALSQEICSRSPDAVRQAKRLLNSGWSGSAPETLALEARLQRELIGTGNQLAAMAAALAGQQPRFADD